MPRARGAKKRRDPDPAEKLTARMIVFAALVVGASALALSLVVSTLGPGAPVIDIPAPVYTVEVFQAPAAERDEVNALIQTPGLKSLAGRHSLFVVDLPGGPIAVCAGRFEHENDPEAVGLAERMRAYRSERGVSHFQRAAVVGLPD